MAIPVDDAAQDFLGLRARAERTREPATLIRDGEPVGKLVPVPRRAATGVELADRWAKIPSFPVEAIEDSAAGLEQARAAPCAAAPPYGARAGRRPHFGRRRLSICFRKSIGSAIGQDPFTALFRAHEHTHQ